MCPSDGFGFPVYARTYLEQGGDGLVAARHLWHFGYRPTLFYPKQGKNDFYQKLRKQCINLGIDEIDTQQFERTLEQGTDVVMDAIFGFSFSGEAPRAPFDTVIEQLKATDKPIVSVDIPSGWTVEKGDPEGRFFTPGALFIGRENSRERCGQVLRLTLSLL